MRKFLVLVKKEIKELLTLQVLAGMLVAVILFMMLGSVIRDEGQRIGEQQNISVIDYDKSDTSAEMIKAFSESGLKVQIKNGDRLDKVIKALAKNKEAALLIIPDDFETDLLASKKPDIEIYGVLGNFSFARLASGPVEMAKDISNEFLSDKMILEATGAKNSQIFKAPVDIREHVIANNKTAAIGLSQLSGFIMSQSMLVPVILFFIMIMGSQMIANAIASEKENKTLETMLSVPVNRKVLVLSKMVAGALLALAAASFYMFSFKYYMDSLTRGPVSGMTDSLVGDAIKTLGLTLTPSSYVIVGISMFFAILCALSIATILGALAENVKSVQGLMTPMTFIMLIPYLLSMFVDINSLATIPKYLILAIPFTHAFTVVPNLYAGLYRTAILGIIYEAFFVAVFVYIAGRIFSSDKILTMKLRIRKTRGL